MLSVSRVLRTLLSELVVFFPPLAKVELLVDEIDEVVEREASHRVLLFVDNPDVVLGRRGKEEQRMLKRVPRVYLNRRHLQVRHILGEPIPEWLQEIRKICLLESLGQALCTRSQGRAT